MIGETLSVTERRTFEKLLSDYDVKIMTMITTSLAAATAAITLIQEIRIAGTTSITTSVPTTTILITKL